MTTVKIYNHFTHLETTYKNSHIVFLQESNPFYSNIDGQPKAFIVPDNGFATGHDTRFYPSDRYYPINGIYEIWEED